MNVGLKKEKKNFRRNVFHSKNASTLNYFLAMPYIANK